MEPQKTVIYIHGVYVCVFEYDVLQPYSLEIKIKGLGKRAEEIKH